MGSGYDSRHSEQSQRDAAEREAAPQTTESPSYVDSDGDRGGNSSESSSKDK